MRLNAGGRHHRARAAQQNGISSCRRSQEGACKPWTDKRFCIDLQNINLLVITAPVHSYMPVADQLFHVIGDCSFISKIGMRNGFFQLLLNEDTKHLTSFW